MIASSSASSPIATALAMNKSCRSTSPSSPRRLPGTPCFIVISFYIDIELEFFLTRRFCVLLSIAREISLPFNKKKPSNDYIPATVRSLSKFAFSYFFLLYYHYFDLICLIAGGEDGVGLGGANPLLPWQRDDRSWWPHQIHQSFVCWSDLLPNYVALLSLLSFDDVLVVQLFCYSCVELFDILIC